MIQVNTLRGLLLLLLTGLLSGCVSLFPESEPVQLYRFGEHASGVPPVQSTEPIFTVLEQTDFNRAAGGDRILTVNGSQASYIKGARWVSSAQDLFNAALRQGFANDSGPARLVGSGDVARPRYVLKLQVHAFEARYTQGQDAAPDILVAAQASLTDSNRVLLGQRAFRSSISAGENRVGAIVEAFDTAVEEVTKELAAWVNTRGESQGGHNAPQ